MRYYRILILILLVSLLFTMTSCRSAVEPPDDTDPDPDGENGENSEEPSDPDPEPEPDPGPPDTTTLAEVSLGTPVDDVLLKFGTLYEDTIYDEEAGYFGEPVNYWNYQDRIGFVVGLSSEQILRIDVFDAEYATNMGAQVGQKAAEILPKYREYYEELISIHTEAVVPGWFLVEDGKLLIFRFSDGSETLFGEPIPDEAVLVEITLAYGDHFD